MNDLHYAKERIQDLAAKVQFLLDYYVKTEDGYFCFPDGDIWESRPYQTKETHENHTLRNPR